MKKLREEIKITKKKVAEFKKLYEKSKKEGEEDWEETYNYWLGRLAGLEKAYDIIEGNEEDEDAWIYEYEM